MQNHKEYATGVLIQVSIYENKILIFNTGDSLNVIENVTENVIENVTENVIENVIEIS
jgi:hypothetical protein